MAEMAEMAETVPGTLVPGTLVPGTLVPHEVMVNLIGYNQVFYELMDNMNEIEGLLEILNEHMEETLRIAQRSPVKLVYFGGNYSESITSPPLFEKYFLPALQKYSSGLHDYGKLMVSHTDGEMKELLPLVRDSGFDIAECLAPHPMTSYTISSVRSIWGSDVVIWGGIPSVVLADSTSDEAFETWMEGFLQEIAGDRRIVVSMGDNTPTNARFERIDWISEKLAQMQF